MTIQSRLPAAAAVLAVGVAGLTAPVAAANQPSARGPLTDFAFSHRAWGTQVTNHPTVGSGPTAYSYLPCTRRAGVTDQNSAAGLTEPGLFTAQGVFNDGWTGQSDGTTYVVSRSRAADGTLADGAVAFTGSLAQARTAHDGTGFSTTAVTRLESLSILGTPLPTVPTTETVIPVPGVGELTVNQRSRTVRGDFAQVFANTLRLELTDGTVVRVGHAFSRMDAGVTGGVFGGTAWGSQAYVGDQVSAGRSARQPIPCPGTGGEVLTNATAAVTLPDVGLLEQVASSMYGVQRTDGAHGWARSRVESARLLDGQVRIRGIVAQANVNRQPNGTVLRSTRHTRIARLVVNGQVVDVPAPGETVDLAALGTLTFRKVTPTPNGVEVVAAELVLHPGTAQETRVEIGHAEMAIRAG